MQCPQNDESKGIRHEGIMVFRCRADSPHYAKFICAPCGAWIKWASREEAESWSTGGEALMEELRKDEAEASEDAQGVVYGVDLSAAMEKEVRRVTRDEMGKVLQAMANAMKD